MRRVSTHLRAAAGAMRAHARTAVRACTSPAPWKPLSAMAFRSQRACSTGAATSEVFSDGESELSDGEVAFEHPEAGERKVEVSDAEIIFKSAWDRVQADVGGESHMSFPREIVFLCGAPGAGKGTVGRTIMQERDITASAIEMSNILSGERFRAIKDAGQLVGDRDVVEELLRELLKPEYERGAMVDGYPRTKVQAECIRELAVQMSALRDKYQADPVLRNHFKRPQFRLAVLYVEEEESVRRQLQRGKELERENERARVTGVGPVKTARKTDVDEKLARERYRVFKDEVFGALKAVRDDFTFNFIDASHDIAKVSAAIRKELVYQSSLELGEDTYEMINQVPTAEEIVSGARQRMVERLNAYARDHKDLFQEVLVFLEHEVMHIVRRQALAGRAVVRSDSHILASGLALNMALDVLAERGYFVTLDVIQEVVPTIVEPLVPGANGQRVVNNRKRVAVFHIEFKRPHIRREASDL